MKMIRRKMAVVLALTASVAFGLAIQGCGNVREEGKQANCTNNLKMIGQAIMMYEGDYKSFPEQSGVAGLEKIRSMYLDEPKCFVCPSSGKTPAAPGEKLTEANCSYIYFGGLTSESFCGLPIVIEKPGNHDPKKIAYLRIDGSVCRPGSKLGDTAEEIVYSILGKKSGFDQDEMKIVEQAKAWDASH